MKREEPGFAVPPSRKRTKTVGELSAENARLKDMVERYEMLAKESHHRIKNGLQTVSSLLRIQAGREAEEVSKSLRQASLRVDAIAKLHDSLRMDRMGFSVDLKLFLSEICGFLAEVFDAEARGVSINTDFQSQSIPPQTAQALGIVVVELVSNAFDHAFPHGGGTVCIEAKSEDNVLFMQVSDNGIGLNEDPVMSHKLDRDNPKLGLRIASMTVMQLEGKFSAVPCSDSKGACFNIEIPIP